MTNLNWTTTMTIQNKRFNNKPSKSNTYTTEQNFTGMTYEEVKNYLDNYNNLGYNEKLVSYTEIKSR